MPLKFKLESERMQHPQAQLIPTSAWGDYDLFAESLSDSALELIQSPTAELSNIIQATLSSKPKIAETEKQCLWLATAFAHPDLTDKQLQTIATQLKMSDDGLWKTTIVFGKISLFDMLMSQLQTPRDRSILISYRLDSLFGLAASNGHLVIMNRLLELAPNKIQDMIRCRGYFTFSLAVGNGHLDIVNHLLKLAEDPETMMRASNYGAFQDAAKNGHLTIVNRLLELTKVPQAMISAGDYAAFNFAARNGHLDIVNRFLELADNIENMLCAEHYYAFKNAAHNGHTAIVNRLLKLTIDPQSMIHSSNYAAFQYAAQNGHLDIVNRLLELVKNPQAMMYANNYGAFRKAAQNGHLDIVNRLLEFPDVFAYVEMHDQEYSRYTTPFITNRLEELRRNKAAFERDNPQNVFNVDADEARLCFYIIRNLIRQNRPESEDYIRFLLEIPTVKALAHTAVTPRMPNELVRLALTTNNQPVAGILLDMCPEVRALAAQNNFYQAEARGQFDLRTTAQDHESSMRALSTGEQKRMSAAIHRYQPMIKNAGGVKPVFEALKSQLAERYLGNPARIRTGDGRDIDLPLAFDEFNALRLSAETRERALLAYYQNKDHTALRYLSRPNQWMDPHAGYVEHDSANPQLQWSTFESYKPLISMLWMAAKDAGIEPTDGFTLETRLDHFVDELALIGRAHNWDDSRSRTDRDGNLIVEEYDDRQGDKPSCYSGVKRRLYQAVLGHPLLKILTLEDTKQELREYVRQYFTEHITNSNVDVIQTAWNNLCESGAFDACLNELDIPAESQADFINYLTNKYPTQFTEDPYFESYIKTSFELNPIFQAHAIRFATETGLSDLLEARQAQKPARALTTEEMRAKRIKYFSEIRSKAQGIKNSGDNNNKGSKGMEP